jgi:tetratricopeptide (TPR) repeat protein
MADIFDELDSLLRAGDPMATEMRFKELLAESEEAGSASNLKQITILSELAGWYRGISRFDDSETCFNRVLELLRDNCLDNTVQYARTLLNIAGLYRMTGRNEESLACNLGAREIIEGGVPCDEYAYAAALNSLALTYQAMGDFSSADKIGAESLAFVRSSFAAEDHEVATALSNLANIRLRLGDVNGAEALLAEALELHAHFEQENLHHGAVLASMGTILYEKSCYPEARDMFERSCESIERFFGRNIDFATTEHNLARTYQAMGDYTLAILHQESAKAIAGARLGVGHPRTAEYREYLAHLRGRALQ